MVCKSERNLGGVSKLLRGREWGGGAPLLGNSAFTHQYPPFKFEAVSVAFVWAQLRGLKAGKAVGLDNIPARLLKDAADIVTRPLTIIINASLQSGRVPDDWKAARVIPLTIIINASLQSGRVPDDWKAARVIPLFKKGKVEDMENYRPISILCPCFQKSWKGPHIGSCITICSNIIF